MTVRRVSVENIMSDEDQQDINTNELSNQDS